MATRVRFTKDFDYEIRGPRGALLKSFEYRKGDEVEILEAAAKAAEKAGVIEYVENGDRGTGIRNERTRRN